jgi:hypothetical protein
MQVGTFQVEHLHQIEGVRVLTQRKLFMRCGVSFLIETPEPLLFAAVDALQLATLNFEAQIHLLLIYCLRVEAANLLQGALVLFVVQVELLFDALQRIFGARNRIYIYGVILVLFCTALRVFSLDPAVPGL